MPADRALRVGIGGPVGSGKSSLIAALCGELRGEQRMAVVTNDIATTEDAQFLRSCAALAPERIVGVQTGCCPHIAISDDITANLEAVQRLEREAGPLDLVLVESGGDNLAAVFSPDLADVQIFVIDAAGGDDIPRKGGAGVARADLLVINKTDLAPFVGSDVGLMLSEAIARRGTLPVLAVSLRTPPRALTVADWVRAQLRAYRRTGGRLRSSAGDASHAHTR